MGLLSQIIIQINKAMEILEMKFSKDILEGIDNRPVARIYKDLKDIKDIVGQHQNCVIKDLKKLSEFCEPGRMVISGIDDDHNGELGKILNELVKLIEDIQEVLRELYKN